MYGIRLTIAYDGRDFCGWQRQPGHRTVQGVVEEGIATMVGANVDLRGASRTDSGVHAEAQLAAFDSPKDIAPRGFLRGLNTRLPRDVSIVAAESCEVGFSPRFGSVEKTYRYLVLFGEARQPLWRHRSWHLSHLQTTRPTGKQGAKFIDLDLVRSSAPILLGTHDFSAFRSIDDDRVNTIRTMHEIRVEPGFCGVPELVSFEIRGNAFLRQMVRILVGTLVDVGRGAITPDELRALLQPGASRHHAGPTAPPHGLVLRQVVLGRQSPVPPALADQD